MRKTTWIALAALTFVLVAVPAAVRAQQNSNSQKSASAQNSQATQTKTSAAPEDPLAAAARKAREAHKNAPKAVKVFTNDNLPTTGGVSSVGEASEPAATSDKSKATASAAGATPAGSANDAATWRARFAKLRDNLQRDQNELSVMQREIGQQQMQYYGGDPQKAAEDQASGQPLGEAYNKKRDEIAAKQKQVDADQQAISDAQDALRQAGGDPGWGR